MLHTETLPSVPFPSPPALSHFHSSPAFQLQPRAQTQQAPIAWTQHQSNPQLLRRGTYPDHHLGTPAYDSLGLSMDPRPSSRQSMGNRDYQQKQTYPATPRYSPARLEEDIRPRRRSFDERYRFEQGASEYPPRRTASRSNDEYNHHQQQPPSSRRHRSHTSDRVPQHHLDR